MSFFFNGWVIYHCIDVPDLLYPFVSRWVFMCFHGLAVVNSAAMHIGVHVSFWITVLSGYMPRSGLLDHMIVLVLDFEKIPHCFPLWLYQLLNTFQPIVYEDSLFFTPSQHLLSVDVLMMSLVTRVRLYLTVVLICISLLLVMLSILSCPYWSSIYFLWRNINLGLLPIFWLDCSGFCCCCCCYWVVWAVCIKKNLDF